MGDESVEAELDQPWQEDEEAGDAAAQESSRSEVEVTTIGLGGSFRGGRGLARESAGGPSQGQRSLDLNQA